MKAYVIADIGACHEGSLRFMQDAIVAAKSAGCNAIKFQWVSDPLKMARRRGRAEADGYGSIYATYLAWPVEWLGVLSAACQAAGIHFMCTAFLPEDVAVIAPHVRHFKIASFEAADRSMYAAYEALDATDTRSRTLMVSLGMGAEPPENLSLPRWMDLALLHCVSSYPAPLGSMNLCRLVGVNGLHGLSDHSKHPWMGAMALMANANVNINIAATIIEAHLKLHTTSYLNPDAPHAMTEEEFKVYVDNIRTAETVLGSQTEGMVECEQKMSQYRAM